MNSWTLGDRGRLLITDWHLNRKVLRFSMHASPCHISSRSGPAYIIYLCCVSFKLNLSKFYTLLLAFLHIYCGIFQSPVLSIGICILIYSVKTCGVEEGVWGLNLPSSKLEEAQPPHLVTFLEVKDYISSKNIIRQCQVFGIILMKHLESTIFKSIKAFFTGPHYQLLI